MHPDLAPIAFLLGTWSGRGEGDYPTIEPFAYLETVTFAHAGTPFLAYQQRTRDPDSGRPLHAESGYWRTVGDRGVEVLLAHPTGIVEVYEGTVEGTRIELRTTSVTCTRTAKDVRALTRSLEVVDGVLRYSVAMAAVGHPLTHHLSAELRRD